jgi:hypothetical protein
MPGIPVRAPAINARIAKANRDLRRIMLIELSPPVQRLKTVMAAHLVPAFSGSALFSVLFLTV